VYAIHVVCLVFKAFVVVDAMVAKQIRDAEAAEVARPKSTRERIGSFVFEQAKKQAWNAIKIPIVSQIPIVGGHLNEALKQKALNNLKEGFAEMKKAAEEQYKMDRDFAAAKYERDAQMRREGRPEW